MWPISRPPQWVGRAGELATIGSAIEALREGMEDLAVVLAGHGREADTRAALDEAISLYEGMQAQWDIRRAEGRLRAHGIKRGLRGRRSRRPATGWAALTSTEVKIAALIAQGDSTADIAQGMYLSRRTVQTYISRILAKLDAKSRLEIVREAQRQGVSP
jgi:DNA-binding CsgD family transcriptional regulator